MACTCLEKTPKPHDGLEPERQIDVQTSRDHTGARTVNDDLAEVDMSSKLLGEGRNHEFRVRISLQRIIFFLVIPAMGDALSLVHRDLLEEIISKEKERININNLYNDLPGEVPAYFDYTHSLDFNEEPKYSYLRRIFRDLFVREGFDYKSYIIKLLEKFILDCF